MTLEEARAFQRERARLSREANDGTCRRCGGKHPISECPIDVTVEEAAEEAKRRGCCDPPPSA